VFEHAAPIVDEGVKNDRLRMCLVVTAKDGYEAVVSWGAMNPAFGAYRYLLAWEEDGVLLHG